MTIEAWEKVAEAVVRDAADEIGRKIGKKVFYSARSYTRPTFEVQDAATLTERERAFAIETIERVWSETKEKNADKLDFDRWHRMVDTRDLSEADFAALMREKRKREAAQKGKAG